MKNMYQGTINNPSFTAPGLLLGFTAAWLLAVAVNVHAQVTTAPEDEQKSAAIDPAAPAIINSESSKASKTRPEVHVNPEGRVEMHVRNLDLATVLQMLAIQSKRNIVTVPGVTGTVTASLFGVSFEEALTAILDMNNCKWQDRGKFIYIYSAEIVKEMQTGTRQKITRVIRLNYAEPKRVITMVEPLKSEQGKIATLGEDTTTNGTGIGTSSGSSSGKGMGSSQSGSGTTGNLTMSATAGSSYLVVCDYAENVHAIENLITDIDRQPEQVLVEATILRAQLNEDNALGIDFNILGGVDFQDLKSTSPGVTDLNTGAVPISKFNNTNLTNRTDFNDAIPNGGYTFGIIKGSYDIFVRALEQITDVTVLANPKILALHAQTGMVIVGRRDGYLTTTVTETAAVQNVEFLETGTQLTFVPYVSNDGSIRMAIHPKDSTGGLTAANLPFEQTTEVGTNIVVRDGHTILIGGLFREVSSTTRNQVPGVGNIPVAGALFRSSRDTTQREEVIILLTVHVIKDPDRLNNESTAALNDVERYRVGMRQSLSFTGRDRLAAAHYQWALEHLAQGNRGMALWDLGLAINNNPKMLAAIELREKLNGQRAWEEDGSSVRQFLNTLISKENGTEPGNYDRPQPMLHLPEIQGPSGFDEKPADKPQAVGSPPQATPPKEETDSLTKEDM